MQSIAWRARTLREATGINAPRSSQSNWRWKRSPCRGHAEVVRDAVSIAVDARAPRDVLGVGHAVVIVVLGVEPMRVGASPQDSEQPALDKHDLRA